MNRVRMGDILQLHRGYDLPEAKRQKGNVPIFSSSGLSGWHNTYKCTGQNVITGRYGTIGEVFYYDGECWPLNTSLFVSDFKGNNPRYIFYLLKHALRFDGKDKSTVPGVDRNVLHEMKIPYCQDLDEQSEMISILESIDAKIENNASICSELEAMAKLLYDYWFVQFDFPDENGKPYKSSGGKMVWNEQLKREIPEGWKVSKLGRECDVLLGGTPDTNQVEYWDGGIPWLNSGEVANSPVLSSEKTITKKGMTNSATAFACAGAVVMSITRYIRPSILGIDACFNQSVVAVIPTETMRTSFLYPLMRSNVPNYMQLRTGAQQPHINKEIVEETDLICPPKDILNKYYQQVDKVYEMQINTAKETNELQSMRDFLLPMLMNGQVKVNPA